MSVATFLRTGENAGRNTAAITAALPLAPLPSLPPSLPPRDRDCIRVSITIRDKIYESDCSLRIDLAAYVYNKDTKYANTQRKERHASRVRVAPTGNGERISRGLPGVIC